MKTKIEEYSFGGRVHYAAKFKKHWYNKWNYVLDVNTNVPYLFIDYNYALKIADRGEKTWGFNKEIKEYKNS